jgi:small conductance mechanosensitive channel
MDEQLDQQVNQQLASLAQIKSTLLDQAIRFGPRLFVALLIVAAGALVSRWAARWLQRMLSRFELEPPVRLLVSRLAQLTLFTMFLILALQNLGVQLLPLIAGLGVVGAAVALGTQGLLSNLAAGLSIIFTKPFRVGEYISIVGEEGRVESITLFTTTLSHFDQSLVVIPNRKLEGEILHNFGTIRQLAIRVSVGYETDLDDAERTILDVLRANPHVLRDPAPLIQTTTLGEWALNIDVKPWVAVVDYCVATDEINKTILAAFRAKSINIPFPQLELRLTGAAQSAARMIAAKSVAE